MTTVTIVGATAWAGLLSLLPILWRMHRNTSGTTLRLAWYWTAAAWLCWLGVWGAALLYPGLGAGTFDQLWYGVAILLLCPPIAVLGAKRPMSRAWGWFILLPLLLVFGWPAASAWGHAFQHVPWSLEEPVLVGYCLVLLMGVGNYAGTRLTLSALLWSVAMLLLVLPLCPATAGGLPGVAVCRNAAALFMTGAGWIGLWQIRRTVRPAFTLDALWSEFRHDFGVVWARRIQDAINETSRKSKWGVVLTPHGFKGTHGEASSAESLPPKTIGEMEASLRWWLRRFVSDEWISKRLAQAINGR